MIILMSVVVALMFASGSYLLLKRDFIKVVGGVVLISNAANLFIMTAGLSRGDEPIYPLGEGAAISDPLVQAMTLTAIVISFGISALLISMIYRVYLTHRSVDIEQISDIEERAVRAEEAVPVERPVGALQDQEMPPTSEPSEEPTMRRSR
jgi:multicomponent Na+:H+ antiporter subunit C